MIKCIHQSAMLFDFGFFGGMAPLEEGEERERGRSSYHVSCGILQSIAKASSVSNLPRSSEHNPIQAGACRTYQDLAIATCLKTLACPPHTSNLNSHVPLRHIRENPCHLFGILRFLTFETTRFRFVLRCKHDNTKCSTFRKTFITVACFISDVWARKIIYL